MKCRECGGTYRDREDSVFLADRYVREVSLEQLRFSECDTCKSRLFSLETAERIEGERERRLQTVLQSRPLREFVCAADACKILGITRQALSKHRRIRRGFIFQTQFGGKMFYLRESVKRFKETGDGRFALGETEQDVEYVESERKVQVLSLPRRHCSCPENVLPFRRERGDTLKRGTEYAS